MTDDRHQRPGSTYSASTDAGVEPAIPSAAGIGADARRRIGRDLRLFYATILDQPLPERFTRLVEELTADSSNRKGS